MTRLAAENPNQPGDTVENCIEVARDAFVIAAGLLHLPAPLAALLADQAVLEFQKAVAPHVKAPKFELHDLG